MRLLRLVGTGLITLLVITASGIGCKKETPLPSSENPMIITGVVTDYEGKAAVGDKLFTYHPAPRLDYLAPTGRVIGSDITTEEGRYRIEVGTDLLRKLAELDYSRLVVLVDTGTGGWRVIDVASGTIKVNLITGAPAPSH